MNELLKIARDLEKSCEKLKDVSLRMLENAKRQAQVSQETQVVKAILQSGNSKAEA